MLIAVAITLTACGSLESPRLSVTIDLTTTTAVAGQTVKGWLVITNPRKPMDLSKLESE